MKLFAKKCDLNHLGSKTRVREHLINHQYTNTYSDKTTINKYINILAEDMDEVNLRLSETLILFNTNFEKRDMSQFSRF